jgi:ParB-like chromosome segregation protein Spo0J
VTQDVVEPKASIVESSPELRVNPEYERLLPRLSVREFEALKLSIKTEGQHFPIAVNPQHEILDGHTRARACKELGVAPEYEVKSFSNKLLEKKFVVEANLRRRQLNRFEKAELGKVLLEVESKLARQRQLSKLKRGTETTSGPNGPNGEKGRARDLVGKQIGLSSTTFHRALTIMDKGSEDLKAEVREGKTSIAHAYQTVRPEATHQKPREISRVETSPALKNQTDVQTHHEKNASPKNENDQRVPRTILFWPYELAIIQRFTPGPPPTTFEDLVHKAAYDKYVKGQPVRSRLSSGEVIG